MGAKDKMLMQSTVEDRNIVQNQPAKSYAKLQIGEDALTAAFVQFKQYSGSRQMAEVAVQKLMKSKLQKDIQTFFTK